MVNLELTEEQAAELKSLIETSLGDMSSEIAGTDNPGFRRALMQRRLELSGVARGLARMIDAGEVTSSLSTPAVYEELAHPGG